MNNRKTNNVQVSGEIHKERIASTKMAEIEISSATPITAVTAVIEIDKWEKFKKDFPHMKTITVFGTLQSQKTESGTRYLVHANGLSCFHNILGDEAMIQFYGPVILEKKFDFDTVSKLYLKRMLFKTVGPTENAILEATALRGVVPYFDTVEEGTEMLLKANYVADNSGNPPYWRIKHVPEF